MTTKQADTVKKLLETLEKAYGRANQYPAEEPLDQIVYHVLEGVAGKKAAEAGGARLAKTFVDWNEVRVSSEREIEACLLEVRKEDRAVAASNVKAGLEYIYSASCRGDYSVDGWHEDQEQALQFLAEIEGLDSGRAALVLYATRPPDTEYIPFAALGRILTRVGAMKKTTSARAVMSAIHELVEPKDVGRLIYLLTRHGHEVCGVKSYYCTQCKAAPVCVMGRRRVKNVRAARKKSAGTGKAPAKRAKTRAKARGKK